MPTEDHFEANIETLNARLQEIELLNSKCCNNPNEHDIQRLRGLIHRSIQLVDYDLQFRQDGGKDSIKILEFLQGNKRRPVSAANTIVKKPKLEESKEPSSPIVDIIADDPMDEDTLASVKKKVKPPLAPIKLKSRSRNSSKSRKASRLQTPPEVKLPDIESIEVGEVVAVKTEDWILGVVDKIKEDPTKAIELTIYTIKDFETPTFIIKDKKRNHLMRLPKETQLCKYSDLSSLKPLDSDIQWPEFKENAKVYGLYPDTTTLYPAKVLLPPSNYKKSVYKLYFEDDDMKSRDVDARFVTSDTLTHYSKIK